LPTPPTLLQVWHIKLLWFASVSCHLLWFTFAKAMINTVLSQIGVKRRSGFKATKKKSAIEVGPWGCGPIAPSLCAPHLQLQAPER
jgi:hypothetical protein